MTRTESGKRILLTGQMAMIILCVFFSASFETNAAAAAVTKPQAAKRGSSTDFTWDFQDSKGTTLPTAWHPVSGEWTVAPEPEHPTNRLLRQAKLSRRTAILASRDTYCNFELSARLRTDSFEHKSRNWQVGLVFRRQNARRYYKVRITAANIALIRVTPPRLSTVPGSEGGMHAVSGAGQQKSVEQLLVFQPLGAARDSWHTLGIKCQGEAITIKLDERELQTVNDPGVGSGNLGLYTVNTPAFFDDVHLSYVKTPKLTGRIVADRKSFEPFREQELRIYYRMKEDELVQIRVLNPGGKVFNVLTRDVHSLGINCITWNGQGLTGQNPLSGLYTLELLLGNRSYKTQVWVKNDLTGKDGGR